MAEVDTSSYPRPQPAQNPFDTITKFGQAADAIGNVEAGKAVQGAIGPDGQIDRNALAQSLRGTVAGSMKAIPTLNAYETLRQAGHVADEAGLDNFQKRMAVVNHLFGNLASKDNPTIQDVNSVAARVLDPALQAGKYGITFPVVMNAIKGFRGPDGRPLSPAEIKKRALEIQTMTSSSAEQLEAHAPRYEAFDDGTTIKLRPIGTKTNPQGVAITKRIPVGTPQIGPDNKSVLTPPQAPAPDMEIDRRGVVSPPRNALSGAVNLSPAVSAPSFAERYGSGITGAPQAGLAPGVAQAAADTASNSARMGNELTTAANETPANKAIIGNLEKELRGFTPGPLADYKRIGKSFATANLPIPESLKKPGAMFDPQSIADQESFNKNVYNLVQSQFKTLGGTGTDAKLDSASHTSPSELMSHVGIKNILSLLKGNQDAIELKAKEWNKWRRTKGAETYPDFAQDFNDKFDPRIFQFRYMKPKERAEYINKIDDPAERKQLLDRVEMAHDAGWVKY